MEGPNSAAWKPSGPLVRGNAVGQILDDMRSQILSGRIPRGTKLPSEKHLADAYGVSGATVREALRGLATSELVEVRHGSGAYVTAQADRLLHASLQAVIQIERMGAGEVLDVLGAPVRLRLEATVRLVQVHVDPRERQSKRAGDREEPELVGFQHRRAAYRFR